MDNDSADRDQKVAPCLPRPMAQRLPWMYILAPSPSGSAFFGERTEHVSVILAWLLTTLEYADVLS